MLLDPLIRRRVWTLERTAAGEKSIKIRLTTNEWTWKDIVGVTQQYGIGEGT